MLIKMLLVLSLVTNAYADRKIIDNNLIIGTNSASNVNIQADVAGLDTPNLRYNATNLQWERSQTGSIFSPMVNMGLYEFNSFQAFSTAGAATWTRPVGVKKVIFVYCAGGGAGAGVTDNTLVGELVASGAGQGGQGRICVINNPSATIALSIGASGTGSTGNGTAGGNTTIAGCSAAIGGTGGTAASASSVISAGSDRTFSYNASNPTMSLTNITLPMVSAQGGAMTIPSLPLNSGKDGGYPILPISTAQLQGGNGSSNGNGVSAFGNCGGGGGGSLNPSLSTDRTGGNGGPGYVLALEYY